MPFPIDIPFDTQDAGAPAPDDSDAMTPTASDAPAPATDATTDDGADTASATDSNQSEFDEWEWLPEALEFEDSFEWP